MSEIEESTLHHEKNDDDEKHNVKLKLKSNDSSLQPLNLKEVKKSIFPPIKPRFL